MTWPNYGRVKDVDLGTPRAFSYTSLHATLGCEGTAVEHASSARHLAINRLLATTRQHQVPPD